ncbi:hypothetical protein [Massilia eurypsychrophila]|jgi:hypothetical protein|nr:hypothetical protein [Massilia eurypsychrophila]
MKTIPQFGTPGVDDATQHAVYANSPRSTDRRPKADKGVPASHSS